MSSKRKHRKTASRAVIDSSIQIAREQAATLARLKPEQQAAQPQHQEQSNAASVGPRG